MASFVRQFYRGEGVAANDIGAIGYLADTRLLDLWGLASADVARARREGTYNSQTIYDLAKSHGVKIAILYDGWFIEYGGVPSQWVKVGEWRIPHNIVLGGDTVA